MSFDDSVPPAPAMNVEEAAGVEGAQNFDHHADPREAAAAQQAELEQGAAAVHAIDDPANAEIFERLKHHDPQ